MPFANRGPAAALTLAACAVTAVGLGSAAAPAQQARPAAAAPTAAALRAATRSCRQVSHGRFRTDEGTPRRIPICGAPGAVYFRADMDIDCDGVRTDHCNETTDPSYLDDTSLHTSGDQPMNSDTMPYVVVPRPSPRFDYRRHGIELGAVVAVVRGSTVTYAVFADTGPAPIIGEASAATARSAGVDPDPATGGADAGVTYIVFKHSRVDPVESQPAAVELGQRRARRFAAQR
jgi:hypothetical protein